MLNVKDFNGTLVAVQYNVNTLIELKSNIVEEILFYGFGFGWGSSELNTDGKGIDVRDKITKVGILFPYVEQEDGETQKIYLRKLLGDVRKDLRSYVVARNCQAINGFGFGITNIADNDKYFVLVLMKK